MIQRPGCPGCARDIETPIQIGSYLYCEACAGLLREVSRVAEANAKDVLDVILGSPLFPELRRNNMREARTLYDKVLIRRAPAQEKVGAIYIPDNAKEKPIEGTVVAVGEGRIMDDGTMKPLSVKPGDTVMFGKYAGTEVELDGEKLVVLAEPEILLVLGAS